MGHERRTISIYGAKSFHAAFKENRQENFGREAEATTNRRVGRNDPSALAAYILHGEQAPVPR